MVLRSQSVGEQDAADQQGAFRAERPPPRAGGGLLPSRGRARGAVAGQAAPGAAALGACGPSRGPRLVERPWTRAFLVAPAPSGAYS